MQAQGAPRITQATPGPHGFPGGLAGQIGRLRPAAQPFLPDWQDADHRCLLEHDLADQHAPWRALRGSPRQFPGIGREPVIQGPMEGGEIRGAFARPGGQGLLLCRGGYWGRWG